MKKCSKCKIEKRPSEFHKHPKSLDGLQSWCKECKSKLAISNGAREYNKKYWQSKKGKYIKYKHSCKNRGVKFGISFKEFEKYWQKPCHYCNSKIETIGLDRVDSNKGYFLDNIVSCCRVCNRMKSDLSEDVFIEYCRKIVKHYD